MNIERFSTKAGDFFKYQTGFSHAFNSALLSGFLAESDNEQTKKTHYFKGRYENIYIDPLNVPQLQQVITTATEAAEIILCCAPLKAGSWFNAMPPGHRTMAHRHDDDDEQLSAVYYIEVPECSGNLLLGTGESANVVLPQAGQMLFFSPSMVHEVTENQSDALRLSIGMNFGQDELS